MAKNKLTVSFKGFDELKKQLDQISGEATKRAIEGALKSSQQVVARKAEAAMRPHNKTGKTAASIVKDGQVEWTQDTASIDVGFDIAGGGLPSIFLMYGTKLHGQPHEAPDRAVFDAIYGKETKKEVKAAQEEAFHKVIERVMK